MLFTTSEICKTNACLGNVALLSSPNKTNKEDAQNPTASVQFSVAPANSAHNAWRNQGH